MTATKLLYPFSFLKKQLQELFFHGTVLEKAFFFLYLFSGLLLFLYSYTQIDLGLVITRVSWLYTIEKKFQYIGYFDRPLSTIIFVSLTFLFFLLNLFLYRFLCKKKIKGCTVWSIIGIIIILFTFSYTAFSYDLFNYMFDAKILTHYHQNPYLHKALDYPNDPMLGFMHWTQRTYPYGPFWLAITIPFSFLGNNIFIITFFLYKILASASFSALLYYIYRILDKINGKKTLENFILFSLNPLVLFEVLVSAHNDIVMMAFAFAGLYYLFQKKFWFGLLLLCISIGIKFATAALLPVFIIYYLTQKRKKPVSLEKLLILSFSLMLVPLLFVTTKTNFQPWYLLYILPFIPFVKQKVIRYGLIIITFASLMLYASFFATGAWHSVWFSVPSDFFYDFFIITGVAGGSYSLYTIIKIVGSL
jgi:hypothetical protein